MKPPPLPSFHALSQNFISVLFKIGSVHALPFENKSEFKLPLAFGKERAPLRLLLDFSCERRWLMALRPSSQNRRWADNFCKFLVAGG